MLVTVQIGHIDAVANPDEILQVRGLNSIVLGPNDLSGSMRLMGQPRHPDVIRAIETVIAKARRAGIFVGIGTGADTDIAADWADKGSQWLALSSDLHLVLRAAAQVTRLIRRHVQR